MDNNNSNKLENAINGAEDAVKAAAEQAEDAVNAAAEQAEDAIDTAAEKLEGAVDGAASTAKAAAENIRNEKRKQSRLSEVLHLKQLRYGSLSIVITIAVILVVMLFNWVVGMVEDRFAWAIDLSYNKRFSISSQTRDIVSNLDQDVKIYTLMQENSNSTLNTMVDEMIKNYCALGHISSQNLDIVANPMAAAKFQADGTELASNSIIVTNADETKWRVISQNDLFDREYSYNSNYQPVMTKNDFVAERAVTSAILYVTSEDTPKVFILEGHGEPGYNNLKSVVTLLSAQNYEPVALNLADSTVEMGKGDVLMVVAPSKDLSENEYELIKTFLENGGRMYYATQYGSYAPDSLPNFMALLKLYGMTLNDGIIVEDTASSGYYYRQVNHLMPHIATEDAEGNAIAINSGFESNSYVVLPQSSQSISTEEMKQSGQLYYQALTTSETSQHMTPDPANPENVLTETGSYAIALGMDKYDYDNPENTTRIYVIGNVYFMLDSYLNSFDNNKLILSPMEWLVNRQTSVYVPGVSLGTYTMSIPDNTTYQVLTVTVIVAIPVLVLLIGFIIWRRRRHL